MHSVNCMWIHPFNGVFRISEFVHNSILSQNMCTVYENGLIILPSLCEVDKEEPMEDGDMLEPETAPVKWPKKPGIPHSDMFNPEDSWFDAPPEGFSLTVSIIDLTTLPYYFSIFERVNNIAVLLLQFL